MPNRDPFVEGLRIVLAAKPQLKPAPLGLAAGLSDSTLRKLLSGQIASLSVANAKRVAEQAGYDLSTIIALGEDGRGPDIIRLALAIADAEPEVQRQVDAFLAVVAAAEGNPKGRPVVHPSTKEALALGPPPSSSPPG